MSLLAEELDPRLSDAITANPHLSRYLEEWLANGNPPPEYMEQLSRDLKYRREINVLYPVGDPIFIHVYSRPGGKRHRYEVIQPMSGIASEPYPT